jgi:hypothetical protein
MPGQHLKCYCGNCDACLRLMEQREKRAAKYGCPCGVRNCDCAVFAAKFDANHGHEMREYYSEPTARGIGSSLAGIDGLDLRGVTLGAGGGLANERDSWRRSLRGWAHTAMARGGARVGA